MMRLRGMIAAIVAVLLAALVPCAACALTSAGNTGNAVQHADAIEGKSARDYVIRFGLEHKLDGLRDKWDIYTAPSLDAVRGANGKASAAMSGDIYTAGWSGAWLLVRYEKNNGGYRVGWTPKTQVRMSNIEASRSVHFAYWPVTLRQECILTDDPLLESETLAFASAGEELTYLAFYQYRNGREYAYVQGDMDGKPICGFIPFEAIDW